MTEPAGTASGEVLWEIAEAVGLAALLTDAEDPIQSGDRLQSVREGIAEGRDMGIWAEIVRIVDAIIELRNNDQAIISQATAALENIVTAAKDALAQLRQDATQGFVDVNHRIDLLATAGTDGLAQLRTDTTTAINSARSDATTGLTQLRTDATNGIQTEAGTRASADTALQTSITNLSNATNTAIIADRNRLTAIENAITAANTGILARLTKIEQRLTTAGIP
jgi:hypothetical protein